jgi:basic amino acid/polyamine antiporter, APA family
MIPGRLANPGDSRNGERVPPPGKLARRLTRVDALAIGIGSVIGTGIFRTTGDVLRGAGGFGGATLIWLGVGAVSAAGALVYADMAARVPEAGGAYAYVREAFGRYAAFLDGGLNAFVSIPARHAAAIGVIGEIVARLSGVDHPRLFAALTIVLLLALDVPGVRAGAAAQRGFTAAKLALIGGIVLLAIAGAHGAHEVAPIAETLPPLPLAAALAAAWYSYLGWQDAALLTEELRSPERDLAFVLLATVGVVTVGYVGVHVALYLGLDGGAAARGALPALALAHRVLGPSGETVMMCALLVSMVGGAAESLLIRPRIAFALARDGLAPSWLRYVNRGGTPAAALMLHAAIVLALVLTGTFRQLLALLAFIQALTGLVEAASSFALSRPVARRARSLAATALFVAANAALCIIVATDDPLQLAYAAAAVLALSALYPLVGKHAPGVPTG